MKRFYLFSLLSIYAFSMTAQESLQSGFKMLESGSFENAEAFFGTYLKSYPDDRTAQICYGRAVGLNGRPMEANALFASLLKKYPGDFEIQINYNESFLWDRQYEVAKPLYAELVLNYPDSFGAALGYANTLSNLKEYDKALKWVMKARAMKPFNESAKTSTKYIKLGYANQFVNAQQYQQAKQLLNEIFIDIPQDRDALLNLANLFLLTEQVDSAKVIYQRSAITPKDSITALIGIALAEHIGENEREALRIAELAKSRVNRFGDDELTERSMERYGQALIWNRKFKSARKLIGNLQKQYSSRPWLITLEATLSMYTGEAKRSIINYDVLLNKDGNSFDGNLGKANALLAADQIIPAYQATFHTLDLFENQKDAIGLLEKLNHMHTPSVTQQGAYSFDNGNNLAFSSTTSSIAPFSTKFVTTVSYGYRTTENTVTGNRANAHVILAGMRYKLLPKTNLKTVVGLNNARFMEEAYTQPVLELKLMAQPYKLQNLEFGYQREVQNFNADLIEREIVMNHYGLNYNLGTNFNLGWYTQLMYTEQSDANTRNLLFTSLYYTMLRKPALKLGINYQYIAFQDQVPTVYFSPEKYAVMELFSDIRGNLAESTNYVASIAMGLQQVEQDLRTSIFRAEVGIQHQFTKRLSGNIYGKYSNLASATAAGFEFTELGLKLRWTLTKKPIFYDKVAMSNSRGNLQQIKPAH
ncbi:MAG: tetratricopeptide repeat protein [Flavobacteriaceae bacterium]